MIRSGLYRKSGGLDARFFAHMEEIDLCWRVQLAGYKVTVVPESHVYHVGGGSLPNGSPKKLYLNYRNNLLMLRKNLAKTIALKLKREGLGTRESAAKGISAAKRTILARMILDGMSAAVYLADIQVVLFQGCREGSQGFQEDQGQGDGSRCLNVSEAIRGKGGDYRDVRHLDYPAWSVLPWQKRLKK